MASVFRLSLRSTLVCASLCAAIAVQGCKSKDDAKAKADPDALAVTKPTDPLSLKIDETWNFADPSATQTAFETMLTQVDPTTAQAPLQRAEILTQIARCQGLQQRWSEAAESLEKAQTLTEGTRSRASVRVLLESGRIKNSRRLDDRGAREFTEAWNLSRELREDALAVDAAHMLAIVLGDDPRKSIEWNERALRYAEASVDDRAKRWKASLYNNLGWAYHDLKSYPAALDMFRKAQTERERNPQNVKEIRIAKWSVGRALRSLGKADEALEIQRSIEQELAASGETDGFNEEELAECLTALSRPDEARPHFAKAYDLLKADRWIAANQPDRLSRLRTLGGE